MGNCLCPAGESEDEEDFQQPSPRPRPRPVRPWPPQQWQRQQQISTISNNYHYPQAYNPYSNEAARVSTSTQQFVYLDPRTTYISNDRVRHDPSKFQNSNHPNQNQKKFQNFKYPNQRDPNYQKKEIRKLEINSQNFNVNIPSTSSIIKPSDKHNHVIEFKFWSNAFDLIDKSQDPKKQKEFSLLEEFNREIERNSKMAKNGFEKLGYLDWGNIRGFGIRDRDKENGAKIKEAGTGYVKAIRKISRLISRAFEYIKISPRMTLNNLKELIGLADQVVEHRTGQLNVDSLTFANHKMIKEEWKRMRDALRKTYFNKLYRNVQN